MAQTPSGSSGGVSDGAHSPGSEEAFQGVVGDTYRESRPWWPQPVRPPEGSPNVLFIVLDDVGYGQLGCYGGEIHTPNIDRLAANGLRYTNWHTTALCSPTRTCLLTGRNHHSAGVGVITEISSGFPGYSGRIPKSCGFLSRMLLEHGYSTYAVGKWHLTPNTEFSAAAPKDRWPLGQGFERYYGFMGGETNQWYPALIHDNHPVDPPKTPEEGYHLTEDLVDKAMEFLRDGWAVTPDKPFFLYFCTGAGHSPHHVSKEWADKYKGAFDKGWDQTREDILARQKQMGVMPPNAELSPRNPLGPGQTEVVQSWDGLPADEKRLYARMMEVFAGFISHTDHQIGRVLDFLEQNEALDNTLIFLVSDNGASGEGGVSGSVNSHRYFNQVPEYPRDMLGAIDELGSPTTYNHYPLGWTMAGDTPLKMWKRYVWEGGISDPCIISWPRRLGNRDQTCTQYHHAVDIAPTVLEAIGITPPTEIDGVPQKPLEGVSMAYTWAQPAAPTRKQVQYYEMLGQRAIWAGGWKAVAQHEPLAEKGDFDKDVWALYHTDEDPAELHDLAAAYPDKLKGLVDLWWVEARKYNVLPLDDRKLKRILTLMAERPSRGRYVYYPNTASVPEWDAPSLKNLPHTITANVIIPPGGAEGVLIAHGSRFGGYTFYVKDGRLVYTHNYVGESEFTVVSHGTVPTGQVSLRFRFQPTGVPRFSQGKGAPGMGLLFINRRPVGMRYIPHTTPIIYDPDDGQTVGRDGLSAVSSAYQPPFAFTGTIEQVVIEVSGIARHLSELGLAIMARE